MTYRFTKEEIATWPLEHKGCWQCKNVLPFSSFHKAKWGMFGLNTSCKACRKPLSQEHYKTIDPRKSILARSKARAKRLSVDFNLTVDDIVIPKVCPVLGITLEIGAEDTDTSPSIDRIIPELGYLAGNIIIISNKANRIKNNATPEELLKVAAWSYKITTDLKETMLASISMPAVFNLEN